LKGGVRTRTQPGKQQYKNTGERSFSVSLYSTLENTEREGLQIPVVKSVDILSLAKIGALFGIVMGLVWGIFYGLLAASVMERFAPLRFGAVSGVAVLIVIPVFGAIMGFIMGAIHASLYNVFAGWVGGIGLEFRQ
jgi:hypothetical protein